MSREHVLIAGAGVAAVEAVLALRHLAGRSFELALLAPEHALVHRPASVASPFGLEAPAPLDLREVAVRYDVDLIRGELAGVDVQRRAVRTTEGAEHPFDRLLVAVGARPVGALDGALTFRGPVDVPKLRQVLDQAADGRLRRIAIAVPGRAAWTLPAYELAVLTANELGMRAARGAQVTVVTPERAPLWLFGTEVGAALREFLDARGIGLRTDVHFLASRNASRSYLLFRPTCFSSYGN
jgi:sulfide:quinone oxidoreductase